MSIVLYRLGRLAYRRRWAFIVPWLVALGATLFMVADKEAGAITANVTIDGTPSQSVLDQLRAELPAAAGGQGTIVFTSPTGKTFDMAGAAAGIATAAARIAEIPQTSRSALTPGSALPRHPARQWCAAHGGCRAAGSGGAALSRRDRGHAPTPIRCAGR